jgi:hypothetical protein
MATKDKYGQFMARKKKKMALYEVFTRSLSNSRRNKDLQRLRPPESANATSGNSRRRALKPAAFSQKPRIVQVNRGRLEISVPYQLAIAIGLAVVLLALVSYRFGQHRAPKDTIAAARSSEQPVVTEPAATSEEVDTGESEPGGDSGGTDLTSTGNNRIVIQTWKNETQLIPVQAYFSGHGIETEIRKIGQVYYLVTTAKYDNPQRPGTDGYKAKQRIVELGAGYEAPAGYGSFDFKSAYGKKFDD